jgi:hypothetical protein
MLYMYINLGILSGTVPNYLINFAFCYHTYWHNINRAELHRQNQNSRHIFTDTPKLFSIFAGCIGIFAILNVLTRNLVGLSRLPLPHPAGDGERTEELQHLNAKVQVDDGELPQEGNTEKEKKEKRESQKEAIVA